MFLYQLLILIMNYYKHWGNFHTISQKIQHVLYVQFILVYIAFAVQYINPYVFITYIHDRCHSRSSLYSSLKSPRNGSTKH